MHRRRGGPISTRISDVIFRELPPSCQPPATQGGQRTSGSPKVAHVALAGIILEIAELYSRETCFKHRQFCDFRQNLAIPTSLHPREFRSLVLNALRRLPTGKLPYFATLNRDLRLDGFSFAGHQPSDSAFQVETAPFKILCFHIAS